MTSTVSGLAEKNEGRARDERAFLFLVNAMFLTRFFLWQYFYQMLYAIIPIVALAWWFARTRSSPRARSGEREHGPVK